MTEGYIYLFGRYFWLIIALILPMILHSEPTKISSFLQAEIIHFDGHDYVYFRNTWNSAANKIKHSPNCKCRNVKADG